jgi:hypothetical protein
MEAIKDKFVLQYEAVRNRWHEWEIGDDEARAIALFEKWRQFCRRVELVEHGVRMIARSDHGKVIPLPPCQLHRE